MLRELQLLLCATNWMQTSIPNYSKVVEPLHSLMKKSYAVAGGKITKRAILNLSITAECGTTHDEAFAIIVKQLDAAAKLACPKPESELCPFTDALDTHWSGILTQVPKNQRDKGIDIQEHEPLCLLSGAFKGSGRNWSTPERKGLLSLSRWAELTTWLWGARFQSTPTTQTLFNYMTPIVIIEAFKCIRQAN